MSRLNYAPDTSSEILRPSDRDSPRCLRPAFILRLIRKPRLNYAPDTSSAAFIAPSKRADLRSGNDARRFRQLRSRPYPPFPELLQPKSAKNRDSLRRALTPRLILKPQLNYAPDISWAAKVAAESVSISQRLGHLMIPPPATSFIVAIAPGAPRWRLSRTCHSSSF
jgi:hypothetical protein